MENEYFLVTVSKRALMAGYFIPILPINYEQDFSREWKQNENVCSFSLTFGIPIKRKMDGNQYLLF